MRKKVNRAVVLYVLYGLAIYWYLFYGSRTGVPAAFEGTNADPATFMSSRELLISTEYSRIKEFLFFLSTPFEWMVIFFFLISGLSKKVEIFSARKTSIRMLQIAIYYFFFSVFVYVSMLPFQLVGYKVSKVYNISVQPFTGWMKEQLLDFAVNFVIMLVVVQTLLYLIKNGKNRWWIYSWLLSIPFTLFLSFIQPVILDPLYNDFTPIQNKQLEEKILAMAKEANIPVEQVYEVEMSDQTNGLNAYVTGIGSNARIVLWDTTLERLSDDEILFIMAHEMSHYVNKHIYWGMGFGILLTFFGLCSINKTIRKLRGRWRGLESSFALIPVFLLMTSLLTFIASPLTNLFSRYEEEVSDAYAVSMTGDKEAGIQTFQSLSKAGLSEVNPPTLVKIFMYTHPTIFERITTLQETSIPSEEEAHESTTDFH